MRASEETADTEATSTVKSAEFKEAIGKLEETDEDSSEYESD